MTLDPSVRVAALVLVALAAAAAVRGLSRWAPRVLGFRHRYGVAVVVGCSALAAAWAPGAPTGIGGIDIAFRMAVGALVAFFASRAPRWSWLTAAGIAAVGAHPDAWGVVGFAVLGASTGAALGRRWARPISAVWGAVLAQVLLRMTWPAPVGLTALFAGVALAALAWGWYRVAPKAQARRARSAALALGVATAAVLLPLAVATVLARTGLTQGARSAEAGLAAMRAGQPDEAAADFERAERRLDGAHAHLSSWWTRPARAVPVVGRYLADAEEWTGVGADLAARAGRVTTRVSEQLQVVDGGIDLDELDPLDAELTASIDALDRAATALRTPSAERWTPGFVRARTRRLAHRVAAAADDARLLRRGVALAPGLLGEGGPRRWLLVIDTPAEQRAAGGHIGNYGELITEGGAIRLDRFGRFSEIYRGQRPEDVTLSPELAEAFARYGDVGITHFIQNGLQTPDFAIDAAALEELYPQLGGRPVTGTIAVDPTAIAALLEVTGPITVPSWPEPITAENAERLLYFEQYKTFQPLEDGTELRVDFLGEVARTLVERLTTGQLGSPSALVRVLAPMVDAGHLQVHSGDAAEQAFLVDAGLAHTMPALDGSDVVRVATRNASQSKLEWFLHRSVSYEPVFDPGTGHVDARLEVTLRNDAPAGGLPGYILGGTSRDPQFPPRGYSRLAVTIYSPLDLDGATLDGAPLEMTDERHLGYHAYAALVVVPPKSSITLALDLSGAVAPNQTYRLVVGNQPQVHPDELTIRVRGTEGWTVVGTDRRAGPQRGEESLGFDFEPR